MKTRKKEKTGEKEKSEEIKRQRGFRLLRTKIHTMTSEMSTALRKIKSQLDPFNSLPNTQKEVKASLHGYVNDNFGRSNENIIEEIKEIFQWNFFMRMKT